MSADGDAQHFSFRQPDRGLDLGTLAARMAAVAGITALPAADIEQIPAGVRHRPGLEGFVLEWEVDRLLGKGNSRREETREECDPKTAYPADNAEAGRNSFSPVGGDYWSVSAVEIRRSEMPPFETISCRERPRVVSW